MLLTPWTPALPCAPRISRATYTVCTPVNSHYAALQHCQGNNIVLSLSGASLRPQTVLLLQLLQLSVFVIAAIFSIRTNSKRELCSR